MAILKDALVQGDLVATGDIKANTITADNFNGPTTSLFVTVTYANYAYTADTTYTDMMSAISNGKNIVAILVDSSQSKSWYYTMTYAPKNTSENFCFATEDELGYFRHLLVGNSDSWWVENIDISSYAKKASPTFTGTPKAPTAAATTNNTQIATTAFVKTVINRTTAVSAADTNYTTYMARGMALNTADTNPTVNGAISWTYK